MSVPSSIQAYTQGPGSTSISLPYIVNRPPASTDVTGPNGKWRLGQTWVDTSTSTVYTLAALAASAGSITATWDETAGAGALNNLAGDTGTASPSNGTITIAGTTNQITTAASSATVTLSLPSAITAPGSLTTTTSLAATTTVTAGTGLTVTTGDATVTAGNVIINGAAKQLQVHGGAVTDFIGSAVLVGGTVTVANTNIAATDRILVVRSTTGGTPGHLSYTISAATSFTINSSSGTDTSTVVYLIVRQV